MTPLLYLHPEVVRQGFDPGLQVFLCQQQGVHTSCGSDPALVYKVGCRRVIDWLIYSGLTPVIPKGYVDNKNTNNQQNIEE
jgi:hypothetical protein